MKLTYIDTDNVGSIGNSIISLANEYEMVINELFKRLSKVPYDTQEWVGGQAIRYFNIVAQDKADFISFGEEIKKIGKMILNHSEDYENMIQRMIKEDNKKELL